MSQKFENLSALIDGENSQFDLSGDELISALKTDTELADKWHSYHLIRYSLRKELPENLQFDIASRVAQALENEPVILAPKVKKGWKNLPLVAAVLPFARQGGQLAIAASVAVAMIIGVQQFNHPDIDEPFNSAAPIPGIAGGLSPVSFQQTQQLPQNDQVEQRRQINAYLADHQQQMRLKTLKLADNMSTDTAVKKLEDSDKQTDIVDQTP